MNFYIWHSFTRRQTLDLQLGDLPLKSRMDSVSLEDEGSHPKAAVMLKIPSWGSDAHVKSVGHTGSPNGGWGGGMSSSPV